MKKLIISAALIALSLSAFADNKFDARGEVLVNQYRQFIKDPSAVLLDREQLPFSTDMISRSGDIKSSVSIKLADGVSHSDIESLGFNVIAASKTVMVIEGSMEDIIALADSELVKSVSFPREADLLLDQARKLSGVDAIHEGTGGLPQAYTGKGIITGIFDNGFHVDHYNFKDADGKCRISNFWVINSDDGTKITHYDSPEKIIAMKDGTDSKSSSHGTHTLGCMSGFSHKNLNSMVRYFQDTQTWEVLDRIKDKNGKPSPWYGPAKDAEIIVSSGSLFDQSIMTGIGKLAEYIDNSGKPGVINLSIGSMIGPRDGSDEFCTFVDEIAEKIPVCIAAGNDGDLNLCLTGNSFNFFIVPEDESTNSCSGILDLWGDGDKAFTFIPVIFDRKENKVIFSYEFNGSNTDQVIIGTDNYQNATVKSEKIDNAFSSTYLLVKPKFSPVTGRYNVYVQYQIGFNSTNNSNRNLVFGFMVSGADNQRVDLASRQSSGSGTITGLGLKGWSNGTTDMTINSMACGKNSIAVGAWNTRNQWGITTNGKTLIYYSDKPETIGLGLDDIAGYSSYGELVDGRRLPHFCAPGTAIISSVSTPGESSLQSLTYPTGAYTAGTRKDMWGLMQGTSMSTPFAAGCFALWLEADPTLTPAEIRKIAEETCDHDSYTAVTGNEIRWGAGKLNALAGLKKVLNISGDSGINDIIADGDSHIQLTPSGYRSWTAFVANAASVNLKLYNAAGQLVANVQSAGDEATLDASNLHSGIYVLNINGIRNIKLAIN